MEQYKDCKDYVDCNRDLGVVQEVYRVIDDGACILTTLDARKALLALMELIEKHDVTVCWADKEILG